MNPLHSGISKAAVRRPRGFAWRVPALIMCATVIPLSASSEHIQFLSDVEDAAWRRTDPGTDDPIAASPGVVPDILSTSVCAWCSPSPSCDPYSGEPVSAETAHLFRLDLVVRGLVNPPGPTGGAAGFCPTQFGPSPLYGYVEIDVDQNVDTGGEEPSAAVFHYAAVAGRFGLRPPGTLADRIATRGADIDFDWTTAPFYERSGHDFSLSFCGCGQPQIVFQSGNKNSIFESGETFIVRGRFLQRAGGYRQASSMIGGSAPGRWDPIVNVRFSHNAASDVTSVTLVGALDMAGAALLSGEPEQPVDTVLDVGGSHTSLLEAISDLIANAGNAVNPLAHELVHRWAGQDPAFSLSPLSWRVRSLVGCSYAEQLSHDDGAYFAWTDVAHCGRVGDLDADGLITQADRAIVSSTIDSLDGGPDDADQVRDGSVVIPQFGPNFQLTDINGDGRINQADLAWYPPVQRCAADWNEDDAVSVQDLFDFLASWFANDGDFNHDEVTGVQDLFDFLAAWFAPCL